MLFSQTEIYSYKTNQRKTKILKIIIPLAIFLILIAIIVLLPPLKSTMPYSNQMLTLQVNKYALSNQESMDMNNFEVESSNQKIVKLQTSQIGFYTKPSKRQIKDKQPSSNNMNIIYFHKNSEIAIVYDLKNKKIKFSAPADTGYKFLFPNGLSNEDISALSQIILYLPLYLIEQFEKVTGNKIKFTTQLAYDGVYNQTSKKYKIVSEKYLRFSEKVIGEKQKDLADYVPVISNISDVKEVARQLAKCYSNIVENFLSIVKDHQKSIEQLQRNLEMQSISVVQQSKSKLFEKVLSCISLQPQILRCQAQVWRSNQLQVDNIDVQRPLEIWSYVLYSV